MGEGFGKDGFVSTMHAPLMVSCPPVGAGIGLVVAFLLLNKELINTDEGMGAGIGLDGGCSRGLVEAGGWGWECRWDLQLL